MRISRYAAAEVFIDFAGELRHTETNQPRDIWNSQGISGNVFENPRVSSSSFYPGECNPWISNVSEDTLVCTSMVGHVTCGERQIPDTVLNPIIQAAGNSFDPNEGCEEFPTPTTFANWKMSFKIEVCVCLQFLTECTLWIKEVEMIELVDDLKFSRSIKGTLAHFELFDARIASVLNKIIQNTRFKEKGQSVGNGKFAKNTVSFEEDRLLT